MLTLEIDKNKMTALVGHSGAGKTTILNLIPRFYKHSEGQILIDNQSISESFLKIFKKKHFLSFTRYHFV